MTKITQLRIQPFLDHYDAYKAWQEYGAQFDNLAKLLNLDNNCYLFDTPWQRLVEDALAKADPDLWEWYQWWLFETGEGTSGEFSFEDEAGGSVSYNVDILSLQDFLHIIAYQYE